jgi:hypothetical protein
MSAEPTTGRLLDGVVETLETVVLPELPRGGAARRQLNAAIDILRRLAFAAPRVGGSLDADNADIAITLRHACALLVPDEGHRLEVALDAAEQLEGREARNRALLAMLGALQETLGQTARDPARRAELSTLLRALYRRMLDREIALIPPSRHTIKGNAP